MAITITNLNGTDSVASSRITLNDNFQTIVDALNDVLSIIDIATGKIDNSTFGSNNDLVTEDLTVTGSIGGGITVNLGNITVSNGTVIVGGNNIQVGTGSNAIYFEKITKTFTGGGNIPVVNLCGIGTTGGTGSAGYLILPRLATADINAITTPHIGAVVFDVTTGSVKVCTASGATGTWTVIGTQS